MSKLLLRLFKLTIFLSRICFTLSCNQFIGKFDPLFRQSVEKTKNVYNYLIKKFRMNFVQLRVDLPPTGHLGQTVVLPQCVVVRQAGVAT